MTYPARAEGLGKYDNTGFHEKLACKTDKWIKIDILNIPVVVIES